MGAQTSRIIVLCILLLSLWGQAEPTSVNRAESGPAGLWELRSKHLTWGMPQQTDNRHNIVYPGETTVRPGISVLVREGFVVGHYDLYKVPAWVSMRWSREDYDRLMVGSPSRNFKRDKELPKYAQAKPDYEYSTSRMELGHMARHEDNEAYGLDNCQAGCLMSNVVPQHRDMNGEAWNDLENLHQEIVVDSNYHIDTVWIISGPVFDQDQPEFTVGNDIAVPKATYKVIGWFDENGDFNARGYIVKQEDRVRRDPGHYQVKIREIEAATGLNFFPKLEPHCADLIEDVLHPTLWGPVGQHIGGGAELSIHIVSLLPDPEEDESLNESITLRNDGTQTVSLDGWRFRDAANRYWHLSGVIDGGDERTFTRNRQQMALNNDGDTVCLLNPSGEVVDSVTYTSSTEGEPIIVEMNP